MLLSFEFKEVQPSQNQQLLHWGKGQGWRGGEPGKGRAKGLMTKAVLTSHFLLHLHALIGGWTHTLFPLPCNLHI